MVFSGSRSEFKSLVRGHWLTISDTSFRSYTRMCLSLMHSLIGIGSVSVVLVYLWISTLTLSRRENPSQFVFARKVGKYLW